MGQLIAGLFAWAYLPNFSCSDAATCTYDNNKGWRYVWYTSGALVFVLSILRVTIIHLQETPKYLISEGQDEKVVSVLHTLAEKYQRPCSLSLEQLQQLGPIARLRERGEKKKSVISFSEVAFHLKGLFATRRIGLSTALVWFSWVLIGLAYPLYNVFLPTYLASRGAHFGATSPYITWRNYALNNFCSIPGPILAGLMCRSGWFWGRRGTMIIGGLVTMIFFFAYTQVRTEAQNLGFSCAISFCLNIYYGTLYAYTPEVSVCRMYSSRRQPFELIPHRSFPRRIAVRVMELPLDLTASWVFLALWWLNSPTYVEITVALAGVVETTA